ncbi:jg13022 [Pararge aegeria aegeria]|uniref:Jg13022 protein n=1 Tax=Pararge aegeria aegeria TaxID=348720 RepID=A0A8S4RLL2_9NEOP|nr:jg13022 [Pararge aegeria aegeria]
MGTCNRRSLPPFIHILCGYYFHVFASALRVVKAVGEDKLVAFPRGYNSLLPMLAVLEVLGQGAHECQAGG